MSSPEPPSLPTATASPKASAVRVAPGEQLRSVRLPGITLSVRSRPPREGLPPALYVHGLGGSSQNWSALMPLLDGLVDSEALDLPGFGDSPPPDDGNYSLTGHARAVIRHLDAAGRGPVHLFGNSLGGAIATRVAALRPDLVRTLTLVSPALPELRVQRTAVPTAMLALPGIAALFTRFTRGWSAEQRVRGVTALCYGDPGRVTDEGFRNAVEEMERRVQLPYMWDALTRSARGWWTPTPWAGSTRSGVRRSESSPRPSLSTAAATNSSATGWPSAPPAPSATPALSPCRTRGMSR